MSLIPITDSVCISTLSFYGHDRLYTNLRANYKGLICALIYNRYMDFEIKDKPGPKAYEWDERMGPVKNRGQRYPVLGHEILKKHSTMALIERMALEPDFKAKVLGMVDEL